MSSSSWIGFTHASNRDRIEAFIHRCKRSELCSVDTATFAELCYTANDRLFARVTGNFAHTQYHLLPPISTNHFNHDLCPRRHNHALPKHPTSLSDANFMYRLLYRNFIDFNCLYCILPFLCWLRSVNRK